MNQLAEDIHEMAVEKGWWSQPREVPEILMLVVSELAEALEEWRVGKEAIYYLGDKPEGFEIEIADAFIRLLDLVAYKGIDIEQAIFKKMAYNATRPFRHGGKKA